MKEQQIQKKIVNYLESEGCYVVKVVTATKSGVPDIIGCYDGYFFGIEVKTPKTKANVSALQEYNLDLIEECGGQAIVAWDVDQVKEFLGSFQ